MLRVLCGAAALALALSSTGQADEAAAKAIVEKGLQAVGGAEKVARVKAATYWMKGTLHQAGTVVPFTGEWTFQLPDQVRFTMKGEAGGMTFTFTRVYSRGKGWSKAGDTVSELKESELEETKQDLYATRVMMLYPLLQEEGFTLTRLAEVEVTQRPAVGVKVARKGQRDINLYFDKESGLLVKSEATVRDEETGKEVRQEEFHSGYKELDGIKYPMKVLVKRDGKLHLDAEMTEIKIEAKIDETRFDKP